MLSEETVKQIFFQSDRPVKGALLADEVDIVQFANNIVSFVQKDITILEHQRCVKIVSEMNPEVGKALNGQRP